MVGYISKAFGKAKKIHQKLSDPYWRAKKKYISYYEKLVIDEHVILLEASHGRNINGNMFYLAKHLATDASYKDYFIYFSAKNNLIPRYKSFFEAHGISDIKVVAFSSDAYFRLLASAKYLFNDTTFGAFFIKKEGQVYFNTRHGTPLKAMGKKVRSEPHQISNVQRNFMCADYILFPNEFTRDVMLRDYMLENISPGSYVLGGYPRNEIFFDQSQGSALREKYGLTQKRVYAYMPTFRGLVKAAHTSKNDSYLNYYLYELDKQLTDEEILFVNLHPYVKKGVSFSDFKHIRNFPENVETYEFLNAADVLITDYSSVFFDFACSRKKIVLFTYDKEEYLADRGMYMSMDELPFPQVSTPDALLRELRSEKSYDDTAFLQRFCKYENASAAKQLCDYVILGENTGLEIAPIPNNGKENVLLYAGNLAANGITTALRNLLNQIDLQERNYYFCFYTEKVRRNAQVLFTFPEGANFWGMIGDPNLTIWDSLLRKLFDKKLLSAKPYVTLQRKRLRQELQRVLGTAKFDTFIQFNGYESEVILTFSEFSGSKTIFVHNDMLQEIRTRGNQRKDILRYAYRSYDQVAIVTEDIRKPTCTLAGEQANALLCQNVIDFRSILKRANEDVRLDSFSNSTVSEDRLKQILASGAHCFINIGRFSPEKGHDQLLMSFQKFHAQHPDTFLIIMGGNSYEDGYAKTLRLVQELGLSDSAILLLKISNPFPILKACHSFILSSHYEGLGLVLAEADILGLPVVSTDIPGPRGFLKQHGGTLVEDSVDGIYKGMEMLYNGLVPPMYVDYEMHNRNAINEFEQLFAYETIKN